MALIYCRECGKQVSSNAAVCPHCGFEQASEQVEDIKDEKSTDNIVLEDNKEEK